MLKKSLFNTSGTYEVKTNKTDDEVEITLELDKTWAQQLGLPTHKFFIREPNTDSTQYKQLEEKLWDNIKAAAQPVKITDYYYPEEFFQKH